MFRSNLENRQGTPSTLVVVVGSASKVQAKVESLDGATRCGSDVGQSQALFDRTS